MTSRPCGDNVGFVVNYDDEQEEVNKIADELASEVGELRRIGGLNIVRAAHIADANGDDEVALLLVREASVMLSVATKVERLLGIDPPPQDVNL